MVYFLQEALFFYPLILFVYKELSSLEKGKPLAKVGRAVTSPLSSHNTREEGDKTIGPVSSARMFDSGETDEVARLPSLKVIWLFYLKND